MDRPFVPRGFSGSAVGVVNVVLAFEFTEEAPARAVAGEVIQAGIPGDRAQPPAGGRTEEDHTVAQVYQPGYVFAGQLLRHPRRLRQRERELRPVDAISGRCGGGNIGVVATLEVRAAPTATTTPAPAPSAAAQARSETATIASRAWPDE